MEPGIEPKSASCVQGKFNLNCKFKPSSSCIEVASFGRENTHTYTHTSLSCIFFGWGKVNTPSGIGGCAWSLHPVVVGLC